MRRLIYFSPTDATFVKKDVKILSQEFDVDLVIQRWKGLAALGSSIKQLKILIKAHRRKEIILVMFAGYWSVLPVIFARFFGQPVAIILGGTDCVSFPEFNYGSLRSPLLSKAIAFSVKHASILLPVHKSLIESDYHFLGQHKKQGLKAFIDGINTPFLEVYNGFDENMIDAGEVSKTRKSFIVVAGINSKTRYYVKGIDLICDFAKQNPDYSFKIIGISPNFRNELNLPPNVNAFDFLGFKEFQHHLYQSQYILQLSISEGFPNALAEGMLARCIPIGSNVGAISDIIGDCGAVLKQKNIELLQHLVDKLETLSLREKEALGTKARNRIIENYSVEMRQKKLTKALLQLKR